MSSLQATIPPTPHPGRFEDSEVLFVTLILMLGEPPRPPIHHGSEGNRFKYVSDMQTYGKVWLVGNGAAHGTAAYNNDKLFSRGCQHDLSN